MNDKFAFFDFCETLVNFQTADAYVNYVVHKSKSARIRILSFIFRAFNKCRIYRSIDRISNRNLNLFKKCMLWLLKGMPEDILDLYARCYFYEKILNNTIPEVLEIMKQKKADGYKIYIVSGGYDIYLKYFVEKFQLDGLVCSRLKFKNGKSTGTLTGSDCLGDHKTMMLNKIFQRKPYYSESYSDSVTDLPLLTWTNKGIVISKGKSQNWRHVYNFDEIIWNT